jgi:NAD+ kinase
MTNVAVIYKKEDQLISGTAQQVIKDLKSQGWKVNQGKAKFAVVLGGDGTILRAARLLAKDQIPILGVHMGGVGFCAEIELPLLNEALAKVKKGQYRLDERTMIEASVGAKKLLALNDIVISNSGIARVIRVELTGIAEYISDGIIFSTATGSTAYNLSAGGPILTPESSSLIISAICPHTISTRSIVLDQPITAVLKRGKQAILTADG